MVRNARLVALLSWLSVSSTLAAQQPSGEKPSTSLDSAAISVSPPIARRVRLEPGAADEAAEHRIEFTATEEGRLTIWTSSADVPLNLQLLDLSGRVVLSDVDSGGKGVPFLELVVAPLTCRIVLRGGIGSRGEADVFLRFRRIDTAATEFFQACRAKSAAIDAMQDKGAREEAAAKLADELMACGRLDADMNLIVMLMGLAEHLPPERRAQMADVARKAALQFRPESAPDLMRIDYMHALSFLQSSRARCVALLNEAIARNRNASPLDPWMGRSFWLQAFAAFLDAGGPQARKKLQRKHLGVDILESWRTGIDMMQKCGPSVGAEEIASLLDAECTVARNTLETEELGRSVGRLNEWVAGRLGDDPTWVASVAYWRFRHATEGRGPDASNKGLEWIDLLSAVVPVSAKKVREARLQVADAAFLLGDYETALTQYDHVIGEEPDGRRSELLGDRSLSLLNSMISLGESERALATVDFLRRQPDGAAGEDLDLAEMAASFSLNDLTRARRVAERVLASPVGPKLEVRVLAETVCIFTDIEGGRREQASVRARKLIEGVDLASSPLVLMLSLTAVFVAEDAAAALQLAREFEVRESAFSDSFGGNRWMAKAMQKIAWSTAHALAGNAQLAHEACLEGLLAMRKAGLGRMEMLSRIEGGVLVLRRLAGQVSSEGAIVESMLSGAQKDVRSSATKRSPRAAVAGLAHARRAIGTVVWAALHDASGAAREALLVRLVELPESARAAVELVYATQRAGRSAAKKDQVTALRSRISEAAFRAARHYSEGGSQALVEDALADKERLEAELLAVLGDDPSVAQAMRAVSVTRAAAALQPADLLVGYLRLRVPGDSLRDYVSSARRERYFAWALDSQGRLDWCDLGSSTEVDAAVAAFRASMIGSKPGVRGIEPESRPAVAAADDSGKALRRLVLDPVLRGRRPERLLLVPDGDLHVVPFGALPDPEGRYLEETARIVVLDSLTSLDENAQPSGGAAVAAAIFGGPDFDAALGEETVARALPMVLRPDAVSAHVTERWGDGQTRFQPLPGALAEAEAIATIGRASDEGPITLVTGAEATKARFLEVAGTAKVLHLATHGWYAPETVASLSVGSGGTEAAGLPVATAWLATRRSCSAGWPLLAPTAVPGRGARPASLTAEELASIDLRHCELAVLSACQTATGHRRENGDIASLRQALHAAGVRRAVTALWPVSDTATKALMAEFYRRLWDEGEAPSLALLGARRTLREARAEDGTPRFAPRDWAAWVLSGPPDP
jgi:CHAT domain-containing protein